MGLWASGRKSSKGIPEAACTDEDSIREWVRRGADVNAMHGVFGRDGSSSPFPPVRRPEWTPLCSAADGGHDGCVELLLRLGANPFVRSGSSSAPLHYAAEEGRTGVVAALLRGRGADETKRLLMDVRGGRYDNDKSTARSQNWHFRLSYAFLVLEIRALDGTT